MEPLKTGFHFSVEFQLDGVTDVDHRFSEVSGLSREVTTEELTEGGESRFTHALPVRSAFPNLVLKRGMFNDSALVDWAKKAIEDFIFEPVDINIMLLNEEHDPVAAWSVINAYPVKWEISNFNAEENSIVVETFELKYNYYKTLTI